MTPHFLHLKSACAGGIFTETFKEGLGESNNKLLPAADMAVIHIKVANAG